MSEEKGICAGTVLVSFVAGAAIGAGLALLYAPKTGEEMRGTITDFAEDAVDKIKEYTKEAQEKIKTAIEDGKEAIVEKKSVLASAIEAGREAMNKEKANPAKI
jgi:gas vesicle protein